MAELVVICVDCGVEFVEAEGWMDRCAVCCMVLEDHDGGRHASYVLGCVRCDADDSRADTDLQAA